jgi:hypothetical protein
MFSAKSISLFDLTPEGQCYPETVELIKNHDSQDHVLLSLVQSTEPWQLGSLLDVELRGLRIFLVGRFIFELVQFFISRELGIGRLMDKYSNEPERDAFGNPAPPLKCKFRLKESSLLIPGASTSIDMLALNVDDLMLYNSFHSTSFALPTQSVPRPPSEDASATGISHRDLRFSHSTAHDSEFHDCIETSERMSNARISSHDRNSIPRLTIILQGLRLFTALPKSSWAAKCGASPAFFHSFAIQHAEPDKPVYRRKESENERSTTAVFEEFQNDERRMRHWDQINTPPFSLKVALDLLPHLRIRISNDLNNHATNVYSQPINLDLRLSQFCLLLSVYYNNLHEMPSFFPYTSEHIVKGSQSTQASSRFPEYGSDEHVEALKNISKLTMEIAFLFNYFSIRCSFDPPGYFDKDPVSLSYLSSWTQTIDYLPGLTATFTNIALNVTNDRDGILRVGCGASGLEFCDETKGKPFQAVLSVASRPRHHDTQKTLYCRSSVDVGSWADLSWGLDCGVHFLNEALPQALQLTVFMTPTSNVVNLGLESVSSALFNLAPVWIILEFFSCYFSEAQYGNPLFEAYSQTEKLKKILRPPKTTVSEPEKYSKTFDFRLWLRCPLITVPSSPSQTAAPCLQLESQTGVEYRFLSMSSFASHNIICTDLSITFANEFSADIHGTHDHAANWDTRNRELVRGLSFQTRISFHKSANHTDVSLRIPFMQDVEAPCGFNDPETRVPPLVLTPHTVCSPFEQPTRFMGSTVCELTCIFEALPKATVLMKQLVFGPSRPDLDPPEMSSESSVPQSTFSVTASVSSVRLFFIDPVLEEQLPVAVASLSNVAVTTSCFGRETDAVSYANGEAPIGDVQTIIDGLIWADYFKLGVTRSWEPVMEPYHFVLLYETSKARGQGLTITSDSPLHINISSAMLVILEEVIQSFSHVIFDALFQENEEVLPATYENGADNVGAVIADQFFESGSSSVHVLHQVPVPLQSDDRVAFSFLNLTGQRIRIFRLQTSSRGSGEQEGAFVTYLEHSLSTKLHFDATISVAKNLSMVEVAYPGLPNSPRRNLNLEPRKHVVDVQIPGFKWIEGIKVDTLGRKFESLVPRSPEILSKVERDWRLMNALKVLIEVGLENGGRLITVRSVFEVRNNTKHPISLFFHPDPRHQPAGFLRIKPSTGGTVDASDDLTTWHVTETLEPGEPCHLPTLLLQSSLGLKGSHLGCLWIRPDVSNSDNELLFSHLAFEDGTLPAEAAVGYCSKPVQLAKVVNESALIFLQSKGGDVIPERARSGIQVSCPIASADGEQAPFCYAIEIRRSPLVRSDLENGIALASSDGVVPSSEGSARKNRSRDRAVSVVHCPVTYSLSIHPPLVITNLLPQSGRFELMHATRRTVMWYADLEAGEQVSIHSVGLDAPLLLLLNLGFCRTPVGEGALIHHGSDAAHSRGENACVQCI